MNKQQLFENIKRKKSFLCVGLDTDIKKIPEHLLKEEDPIFAFNKAIIDATADLCIAYKPNLAFYESIGDQGELAADGEQLEQPDDHFDSHLSRLETLDLLEASKQNYQGVARLGIEALALKVQGMRITDIAALYQVPPSHVGAWISRSLEKLRNDPDFLT